MTEKKLLQILLIAISLSTITFGLVESEDSAMMRSTEGELNKNIPPLSDRLTNGTQGYYLSPHSLGKQRQVSITLANVLSKIQVQKTIYNHSETTYIIDNFTLQLDYNDGKQKIDIVDNSQVTVTNGTVFFGYRFNYSLSSKTRNVQGWAHGSVYSDALTYKKHFIINSQGFLQWALPKTDAYTNLRISARMGLKRMDPFDQNDHDVLVEMLDRAFQNIQPSNIQQQLLNGFNTHFFPALNDSLNHQVFGRNINYSYHHPTKGLLNMTMVHDLYGFSVDKVDGYKIIFVTEIADHEKQTTCTITVPDTHSSFDIYGGVQNIHLNCLYQDVVNYIQAQGWLDVHLNSDWEVNAFQFYAGDLYDVMNSLYTKVNPRAILEGQCKASKNNLVLKSAREFSSNTYGLNIDYNCTIKTTTKTAQPVDILQFVAQTKFYIKAQADKLQLNFQLIEADVLSLSFTPVNNFIVTNMNLALFKATQVIRKNLNSKVFGSGFPSLPRQSPKTRVDKDSVIYYDASAVESAFQNGSKIGNEFKII